MLFTFIFRFFYCLKVRFLWNKRGMEVCVIMIFFDIKKKLKKYQKKTPAASRPIFAKKKLRNAKKKVGASRRFRQKKTQKSFFLAKFAQKKTLLLTHQASDIVFRFSCCRTGKKILRKFTCSEKTLVYKYKHFPRISYSWDDIFRKCRQNPR